MGDDGGEETTIRLIIRKWRGNPPLEKRQSRATRLHLLMVHARTPALDGPPNEGPEASEGPAADDDEQHWGDESAEESASEDSDD